MLRSIKSKFILSHLLVLIVTAISFLLLSSIFIKRHVLDLKNKNIIHHSQEFSSNLENIIGRVKTKLRRIADSREIQNYHLTFRELSLFQYLLSFNVEFPFLIYLNEDGEEEISVLQGKRGSIQANRLKNNSLWAAAKDQANTVHVSPPFFSEELKTSALAFSFGVKPYFENRFVGVIIGIVPLELLTNETITHRLQEGLMACLLDESGKIIFSTVDLSRSDNLQLTHQLPSNPDGSTRLYRNRILGIDSIISYTPVKEYGLGALVMQPYDTYNQALRDLRHSILGLGMIVGLCVTVFVIFLIRKMVLPLATLSKAARSSRRTGKLVKVEMNDAEDEISNLISSYNDMIENLTQTTIFKKHLQNILHTLPMSLFHINSDDTIITTNQYAAKLLNCTEEEIIGQKLGKMLGIMPDIGESWFSVLCQDNYRNPVEKNIIVENGKSVPVLISATPLENRSGIISEIICTAQDISIRKELEKKRLYEHKIEATRAVIIGIAHEFNNSLTSILGFSQLALEELPENHSASSDIKKVIDSAGQANSQIKKMFYLVRQDGVEKDPLQPAVFVREAYKSLQKTLPANINIKLQCDKNSYEIIADPVQLHQLLTNLCSYAVHTMKESIGDLHISLDNEAVSTDRPPPFADLPPGSYVKLTISFTDVDIDEETLKLIYAPHLTTAEQEINKGWGLSTIHDIIDNHNAYIYVEKTPGMASSFFVYFPAVNYDFDVEEMGRTDSG